MLYTLTCSIGTPSCDAVIMMNALREWFLTNIIASQLPYTCRNSSDVGCWAKRRCESMPGCALMTQYWLP